MKKLASVWLLVLLMAFAVKGANALDGNASPPKFVDNHEPLPGAIELDRTDQFISVVLNVGTSRAKRFVVQDHGACREARDVVSENRTREMASLSGGAVQRSPVLLLFPLPARHCR